MSPLEDHDLSIDSNVATDFYLTGTLGLVETLFAGRLLVSDFVEDELARAAIKISGAGVVSLTSEEELELLHSLRVSYPQLGAGELGAIVVARSRHATLVSNDGKAREAAKKLGIAVSGTLGILEFAVSSGVVSRTRAKEILDEMIAAGSWFSEELLETFHQNILETEAPST